MLLSNSSDFFIFSESFDGSLDFGVGFKIRYPTELKIQKLEYQQAPIPLKALDKLLKLIYYLFRLYERYVAPSL